MWCYHTHQTVKRYANVVWRWSADMISETVYQKKTLLNKTKVCVNAKRWQLTSRVVSNTVLTKTIAIVSAVAFAIISKIWFSNHHYGLTEIADLETDGWGENQEVDNAGLDKDGWLWKGGHRKTGHWCTNSQGWTLQDWKLCSFEPWTKTDQAWEFG